MKLEAGEVVEVREGHIVSRPRLTDLLDETNARIILLLAPAGYGKTTLARQWLAGKRHAWYRGSPASADVAALALGLARAASIIVPGADERLQTHLRVSARVPTDDVEKLADVLGEELFEWPHDAWLAVDDYQFACDSEPAETFLDRLVSATPIQMVVASRTRPRWATARRALYAEFAEVGRNLLAMTLDEARLVLAHHSDDSLDGMVGLADGWPALIGLATLSPNAGVARDAVPEELYGYLAQELYEAASPDLRKQLRRLALSPFVTTDIAESVMGPESDHLIQTALELGFFVTGRERLELHPLLRSFLLSKFRRHQDDPTGKLVPHLARVLMAREEWDDVYELATRFAEDDILLGLFEALPQMLESARLPTLSAWIATARSRRLDDPLIDLADAELAFRRGEFADAEALACQAARRFPDDHLLKSRSLWLAGASAHVAVDEADALTHFEHAERAAQTDEDSYSAIWGQFLAAEALEQGEAAKALLADLEGRSANTVDELLRIATGRLLMASFFGDAQGVLDRQRSIVQLAPRARDPVIHTSFLNAYGWFLNLAGQYARTLEVTATQASAADKYSLDFVIPFAQASTATAQCGLRNFQGSTATLVRCQRTATNRRVLATVGQVFARLYLGTGRPRRALEALGRTHQIAEAASSSLHAEHLAWWSIAHAVTGNRRDALEFAEHSQELSKRIEVSALTPWTRAVLALEERRSTRKAVEEAFATTLATGNIDAFVVAYRAKPALLKFLVTDCVHRERLKTILAQANDYGLGRTLGFDWPSALEGSRTANLTRRESEVLELVSQGLMNKEIARTLFITEATVKVHVRKICQKLGVRSRTEAAMRAAELSG